jgi:catechol 2,3-dioxygenase-like lactoylglutathione lyase family enzyme
MSDGPEVKAVAPRIDGLLETSLYVADLDRTAAFYERVLGLGVMLRSPRLVALDAGRQGVLLLFLAGATSADVVEAGGTIPGHEGTGRLHMAFAVQDLDAWRARLAEAGVALTGEMAWPRGGTSLYFSDPDGHVIELATPGLWPNR